MIALKAGLWPESAIILTSPVDIQKEISSILYLMLTNNRKQPNLPKTGWGVTHEHPACPDRTIEGTLHEG